jgi:cell division protein FtsL
MTSPAPLYRIFKRASGEAPSARAIVAAMIAIAIVVTGIGLVRVAHEHEILSLGYELTRESEQVRQLREVRRQLELERATLTSPERIRKLAAQLGMQPVAPDKIRIVLPARAAAVPASARAPLAKVAAQ